MPVKGGASGFRCACCVKALKFSPKPPGNSLAVDGWFPCPDCVFISREPGWQACLLHGKRLETSDPT